MNLQCCSCFCITLTETNNGDDIQKTCRIVISFMLFVSTWSSTNTGFQPGFPTMYEWSPERSTVSSSDTSSLEAEHNIFFQNIIRTTFLDAVQFQMTEV